MKLDKRTIEKMVILVTGLVLAFIYSPIIYGQETDCEKVQFKVKEELTHVSCYGGNDGRVVLDISGGSEPYSLTLQNNGEIFSGNSIEQLGAGTYWLRITDINNCEELYDFEISEPEFYEIDLGSDMQTFSGMEIALDAGADYEEYMWSTGSTSRITTFSMDVDKETVESISLEAYDEHGCLIPSTVLSITILPQAEDPEVEEPGTIGD